QRERPVIGSAGWYRTKPFLRQTLYLVRLYASGHDEDRVVGDIELVKKSLDVVHRGFFDMPDLLADRRPAIGMRLIRQRAELKPYVAIGLIEIALLKLFNDHVSLHLQYLGIEAQTQHPVRFQPEGGFEIVGWQG